MSSITSWWTIFQLPNNHQIVFKRWRVSVKFPCGLGTQISNGCIIEVCIKKINFSSSSTSCEVLTWTTWSLHTAFHIWAPRFGRDMSFIEVEWNFVLKNITKHLIANFIRSQKQKCSTTRTPLPSTVKMKWYSYNYKKILNFQILQKYNLHWV